MSHRVVLKNVRITDMACARSAAERVGATFTVQEKRVRKDLDSDTDQVANLKLRDWHYTASIDRTGRIHCDSDDLGVVGRGRLSEYEQTYQDELVSAWSQQAGYREVDRHIEADGSIHLTVSTQ
jgi:hypothetical protein